MSSSPKIKMLRPPDSIERFKKLYPAVQDTELLPQTWSVKEKHNFIGLSHGDIRSFYKGVGKTHKDAASVRANKCIPTSCGIYYFEVKIISKGRDGYMGIGLSAHGVNMNRLPGWDKFSWGYHGDDGHSFCSKGSGEPYGPTFTTNDVIGCCVNLVDDTCFYTKNGISLGIAFKDLPHNLFPTIGLQTPGEVIEANFGNESFIYDIDDYILEWKAKTKLTLENFQVCDQIGEWQVMMKKVVSSYLVHHGYCSTAESFARSTDECISEEIKSIKNRQNVQKLVLDGKMIEVLQIIRELYPTLLNEFPDLYFNIKCREFIELANEPAMDMHAMGDSNGSIRLDDIAMEVDDDEDDEIKDVVTEFPKKSALENDPHLIRMLELGKELHKLVDSSLEFKHREENRSQLNIAFSLLAYVDPKTSPMAYILLPSERESICSTLNSAILESQGLAKRPPLELVLGQAHSCMKLMSKSNIALAAFASVDHYLNSE